jgi:nifR3 family TIM-barrel protein
VWLSKVAVKRKKGYARRLPTGVPRRSMISDPTVLPFRPLELGPSIRIWPPVVLAPMAGVTNFPYRRICRRYGAPLCVSEMVSSRGIIEEHRSTWRLVQFGRDETPRSIQIFGCDPEHMGEAARRLCGDMGVDHIDINFGCPVPKLTRKGMGAAVPTNPENCRRVVRAVVTAADPVPVTIKVRLGIDENRWTYHDSGRIAEDEGCRWIAVHGRTARQMYAGRADWDRIRELKESLRIPVLGNGDIFSADTAIQRMHETGVDGVVIGRGCLGNPWLFRDLVAIFEGREIPARPAQSEVVGVVREHFELLREHYCESDWDAILRMRKFGSWYASGFPGAAEFRRRFQTIATRRDLDVILDAWLAGSFESGSAANEVGRAGDEFGLDDCSGECSTVGER